MSSRTTILLSIALLASTSFTNSRASASKPETAASAAPEGTTSHGRSPRAMAASHVVNPRPHGRDAAPAVAHTAIDRSPRPHGPTSHAVMVLAALSMLVLMVVRWDSESPLSPAIHPTHSYFVEWAIDRLKGTWPELQTYRDQIIEGANMELHELRTKYGIKYGLDMDAKRVEHKGTNPGSDDMPGWWRDSLSAYRAGNKPQAYFVLGIMLHMIADMGVPAHANRVYHQGNATEFDNFEFMATFNWKPSFHINRADPGYTEPWRYYAFSESWTKADAPGYHDRNSFSKTWMFASQSERELLSNRQGRTCYVTMWTLQSAAIAFSSPIPLKPLNIKGLPGRP